MKTDVFPNPISSAIEPLRTRLLENLRVFMSRLEVMLAAGAATAGGGAALAAACVIPKECLWVNPDCGLKTRRWEEVRRAVQNLVAAA